MHGMADDPHRFQLKHRRAIVAGYGPVGRLIAEELEKAGLQVSIIETNLDTIQRQLGLNRPCFFGDVRDPDVLHKVHIEQADALILAIPDEEIALEACKIAHALNPDLFIAARTNFFSRGLLARQLGADAVVVEEVVTAEAMRKTVMDALSFG